MADKPTTQRQRRWRERQKNKGKKAVTVVLPMELVVRLKEIKKTKDVTMSALVADLIAAGLSPDGVTNNAKPKRAPVRKRIRPAMTWPDLLDRIDAARYQGAKAPTQKEIAGVIRMMCERHELKRVKEMLNEAGVAPFSGKARWTQAEIRGVLKAGA